ncbi:MAG: peptide-methionine (S)-S-oxide reductase MsrA [Alphaproteobacteria bacterium]
MKSLLLGAVLMACVLGLATVFYPVLAGETLLKKGEDLMEKAPEGYPVATLAGGCFWCTESEYRALDGVLFTQVGYMGGALENPTYHDITTGKSGHAEVVQVTYDPEQISYEDLLEFFFLKAHDPTQLNRQGVDVGTQYRSAIFYADEKEKERAQSVIDRINASGKLSKSIVTTLEPLDIFWVGEDYHQQYYEKYQQQNGRDHIRVIMKKAGKL